MQRHSESGDVLHTWTDTVENKHEWRKMTYDVRERIDNNKKGDNKKKRVKRRFRIIFQDIRLNLVSYLSYN